MIVLAESAPTIPPINTTPAENTSAARNPADASNTPRIISAAISRYEGAMALPPVSTSRG